jgi:tRNA C32,U32 (ribose-2'-O)-methylase TrmJ
MKNMGLRDLVLVRLRAWRTMPRRCTPSTCSIGRVVSTLDEAVADCLLVVGTTARRGRYHVGARTGARRLRDRAAIEAGRWRWCSVPRITPPTKI